MTKFYCWGLDFTQILSLANTIETNTDFSLKKYPSHALLGQHFLRSAAHRDDRLRKKILDSPDTQFQAEMLALEETSVEG